MRFLMLFALATTACSTMQTRPYVQPTMALPAVRDELLTALHAMAIEEQWAVLATYDGSFEAIGPISEVGADTVARERWRFWVEDHHVRVELTLEVLFADSPGWAFSKEVCETYAYSREHDKLARLARSVDVVRMSLLAANTTRSL